MKGGQPGQTHRQNANGIRQGRGMRSDGSEFRSQHRKPTQSPQRNTKKPKTSTYHQLQELKAGEWGILRPDGRRDPLILGKGVLKGRKPDTSTIKWRDYSRRKHAVVGSHSSKYAFDSRGPLNTDDQQPETNIKIMELAKVIGETITAAKSGTTWLRSVNLPPGGFTLATLTSYEACDQTALITHTDNEPAHAFNCIASASFGADAVFTYGQKGTEQTICLQDGDLLIFDRFTPHGVSSVDGDRLNLTFRSWGDLSYFERRGKEYRNQLEQSAQERKKPQPKTKQTSNKQ